MFRKNHLGEWEADLSGICFICDEVEEGFAEAAESIASCYRSRLPAIARFMLEEGIEEFYGDLTEAQIAKSLGKPTIDLGRQLLTYLDHSLDDDHIIELEYDGALEHFSDLVIDG